MLRLTFSQLRHSAGRLISAAVAIVIGTAFVAATLVAADVLDRASVQALNASFGDADLVVEGEALDADAGAAFGEVPGVAAAHAAVTVVVRIEAGGTSTFVPVTPAAPDPALEGVDIVAGGPPGPGEIVLAEPLADRLGLEVGDDVPVRRSVWQAPDGGATDGTFEDVVEPVRVSGLLQDPAGAFAGTGVALAEPEQVRTWAADGDVEGQPRYEHVLLRLEEDAAADEVAEQVAAAADGLEVRSREEHAAARTAELTGSGNVLSAIGLAFGAVALLVAGLVIANTFSVVVAQRTRTLALLRCVGADRGQLRRSVRLEALTLGALASLTGIAIGLGLAQGVLTLLSVTSDVASLPTTIAPGPSVLVVPLLAGLVVTLAAATVPARAASRVSPLAAMRPVGGADEDARVGRRRVLASGVMVVTGLALLAGGAYLGGTGSVGPGLLLGVVGGALSFVGVLVSAVLWVPRVITFAATLVRSRSVTGVLAAANSVRNPRRTAATSSALLIGVTLVAMMSSGASMARASFDQEFDRAFPIDAEARAPDGVGTALPGERIAELRAVDGVADAAPIAEATLQVTGVDEDVTLEVTILDPEQVRTVVRDPGQLSDLRDGTLLVPGRLADTLGLTDRTVTATPLDAQGQLQDGGGQLPVVTRPVDGGEVLLARATAQQLGLDVVPTGAWMRFEDGAEVAGAVASVQDVVADDALAVRSAAAERASFDGVVSTLLRVVLGLLGVAVVIAVVGVANTLSLSVLERGRESATLRAIGLTRRQLRRTLAVEAVYIAGAGALVGSALGTFYGYVGSLTVLGELADGVALAVPWLQLTALIALSLLAGVAASVVPGRRAARTSPVAALATE